jgi:hypothetical protein
MITSESHDPRNKQVLFIAQISRDAFSAFFWQKHSTNKDFQQRSDQLYQEIHGDGTGYMLTAGHVGGNKEYPVTITINFWRRITNEDKPNCYNRTDVPLLATYDYCGNWADWQIGEEFVKKLFSNAKTHANDLNCLSEAFSLIDYVHV